MNLESYEETRLPKARTPAALPNAAAHASFGAGHVGEVPEGGHECQPAHVERQGNRAHPTDGPALQLTRLRAQVIDVEVPNSVILKVCAAAWPLMCAWLTRRPAACAGC